MEDLRIPDNRISASSYKSSNPEDFFAPRKARLNLAPGWCAGTENKQQWLQIDLAKPVVFGKVATQGNYKRWIKTYYVNHSLDNITWNRYSENGADKVSVI